LITGLVVPGTALTGSLDAQQSQAPKDATGQCTDSSYPTAKTQARACLKHGGVKTWFGGTASATAAPAAADLPSKRADHREGGGPSRFLLRSE
jgi:hypothetical protein